MPQDMRIILGTHNLADFDATHPLRSLKVSPRGKWTSSCEAQIATILKCLALDYLRCQHRGTADLLGRKRCLPLLMRLCHGHSDARSHTLTRLVIPCDTKVVVLHNMVRTET